MNNNDWEALLKLLVPVLLLISWAVNQVLQKDRTAPKMPPRPRTDLEPLLRTERIGGETRPRVEPARTPAPARRPTQRGDDVLIIEEDDGLARSKASNQRGRSPKRKPQQARKQPGSQPRNDLTTAASMDRPTYIGPLATVEGLHTGPSEQTSRVESAVSFQHALGQVTLTQLQVIVQSPQRFREALVLNEILQPPLAMRRLQR